MATNGFYTDPMDNIDPADLEELYGTEGDARVYRNSQHGAGQTDNEASSEEEGSNSESSRQSSEVSDFDTGSDGDKINDRKP
jgi:hypothetical protein